MKLKETADMDDTNPHFYTGPPKDKEGESLEKSQSKDKEVSDDECHDLSKISPAEVAASPLLKFLSQQDLSTPEKKEEAIQEWVKISQNEFDEVVGFDFDIEPDEAVSIKNTYTGMELSDTYLDLVSKNLVEDRTKGLPMANKRMMKDGLNEVGLKYKEQKALQEKKGTSVKDYLHLDASKILQEKKAKTPKSSLTEKKEEKPTQSETPLKTFSKLALKGKKQCW